MDDGSGARRARRAARAEPGPGGRVSAPLRRVLRPLARHERGRPRDRRRGGAARAEHAARTAARDHAVGRHRELEDRTSERTGSVVGEAEGRREAYDCPGRRPSRNRARGARRRRPVLAPHAAAASRGHHPARRRRDDLGAVGAGPAAAGRDRHRDAGREADAGRAPPNAHGRRGRRRLPDRARAPGGGDLPRHQKARRGERAAAMEQGRSAPLPDRLDRRARAAEARQRDARPRRRLARLLSQREREPRARRTRVDQRHVAQRRDAGDGLPSTQATARRRRARRRAGRAARLEHGAARDRRRALAPGRLAALRPLLRVAGALLDRRRRGLPARRPGRRARVAARARLQRREGAAPLSRPDHARTARELADGRVDGAARAALLGSQHRPGRRIRHPGLSRDARGARSRDREVRDRERTARRRLARCAPQRPAERGRRFRGTRRAVARRRAPLGADVRHDPAREPGDGRRAAPRVPAAPAARARRAAPSTARHYADGRGAQVLDAGARRATRRVRDLLGRRGAGGGARLHTGSDSRRRAARDRQPRAPRVGVVDRARAAGAGPRRRGRAHRGAREDAARRRDPLQPRRRRPTGPAGRGRPARGAASSGSKNTRRQGASRRARRADRASRFAVPAVHGIPRSPARQPPPLHAVRRSQALLGRGESPGRARMCQARRRVLAARPTRPWHPDRRRPSRAAEQTGRPSVEARRSRHSEARPATDRFCERWHLCRSGRAVAAGRPETARRRRDVLAAQGDRRSERPRIARASRHPRLLRHGRGGDDGGRADGLSVGSRASGGVDRAQSRGGDARRARRALGGDGPRALARAAAELDEPAPQHAAGGDRRRRLQLQSASKRVRGGHRRVVVYQRDGERRGRRRPNPEVHVVRERRRTRRRPGRRQHGRACRQSQHVALELSPARCGHRDGSSRRRKRRGVDLRRALRRHQHARLNAGPNDCRSRTASEADRPARRPEAA